MAECGVWRGFCKPTTSGHLSRGYAICFRSQRPVSASQAQSVNRRFRSESLDHRYCRSVSARNRPRPATCHSTVVAAHRSGRNASTPTPANRNADSVRYRIRRDGVRRCVRRNRTGSERLAHEYLATHTSATLLSPEFLKPRRRPLGLAYVPDVLREACSVLSSCPRLASAYPQA